MDPNSQRVLLGAAGAGGETYWYRYSTTGSSSYAGLDYNAVQEKIVWLSKTSTGEVVETILPDGSFLWSRRITNSNTFGLPRTYSIQMTDTGKVLWVGSWQDSSIQGFSIVLESDGTTIYNSLTSVFGKSSTYNTGIVRTGSGYICYGSTETQTRLKFGDLSISGSTSSYILNGKEIVATSQRISSDSTGDTAIYHNIGNQIVFGGRIETSGGSPAGGGVVIYNLSSGTISNAFTASPTSTIFTFVGYDSGDTNFHVALTDATSNKYIYVYSMSTSGSVSLQRRLEVGSLGATSPIAVDTDSVYIGTPDGYLVKLDKSTYAIQWTRRIKYSANNVSMTRITPVGDSLYLTARYSSVALLIKIPKSGGLTGTHGNLSYTSDTLVSTDTVTPSWSSLSTSIASLTISNGSLGLTTNVPSSSSLTSIP